MRIVKNCDVFNAEEIEKIEAHYSASYVCDVSVRGPGGADWMETPVAVFYQENPTIVPEGGSHYFGLYFKADKPGAPMKFTICDAEASGALEPFDAVMADNGDVIYSSHGSYFKNSPDGSVWIDGGRTRMRHNGSGTLLLLVIKDGDLVIHHEAQEAAE